MTDAPPTTDQRGPHRKDAHRGRASTRDDAYADRLAAREGVWWKRLLDVQAPYRWNLRRQNLGRTLDVGCGLGRNLQALSPDSVGVDHNEAAVRECRRRGLTAYTVTSGRPGRPDQQFDAILLAHVVEHVAEPPVARVVSPRCAAAAGCS